MKNIVGQSNTDTNVVPLFNELQVYNINENPYGS